MTAVGNPSVFAAVSTDAATIYKKAGDTWAETTVPIETRGFALSPLGDFIVVNHNGALTLSRVQ